MDEARKLMDSLMGQTRDIPLKEAKKKKGNNFKEDNCCKFHLMGFCPINEQLFRNTKRHLGECEKVHSDALVEEFQKHPDKSDYEKRYCRDLIKYMESIVRTADEAIARQARNIQAANKDLEERGPNDVAKREIEKIRENCNTLLNEAEELAEAGDIEGSKMKQAIFEQTKQKADDYEVKSKQPIKEEVCEVCGLRPDNGDGSLQFSHTEGKVHIGFQKVREWLTKMRALQATHEEGKESKRERSRSRSRDRRDRRAKPDDEKDAADGSAAAAAADGAEAKDADKDGAAAAAGDGDEAKDKGRDKDRERGGRDRGDDRRGGDRDDRRGGGDRGGDRRGGDRGDRGRGDRGGDDRRGGGDRGGGDRDRRDRRY